MGFKVSLVCLWMWWGSWLFGQKEAFKFKNYSIRDGLSQSTIIQIYQDKKGFMWFATSDGLNQFDGYKFTVFKNNHNQPNSLSDSWVSRFLLEDSGNNLWMLTADRAINSLNLSTRQITRFFSGSSFPPFKVLHDVIEDRHKNIWISTDMGFLRYNGDTKKFIDFGNDATSPYRIKGNEVSSMYEDKQGNLWFSSYKGLYRYNYLSSHFDRFYSRSDHPGYLLSDSIVKVFEDNQSRLWVVTKKGLCRFVRDNNSFLCYALPAFSNKVNQIESHIHFLYDKKGFMWLGVFNHLVRFDPVKEQYKNICEAGTIANVYVTRFMEDKSGGVWVGTSKGLKYYNPFTNKIDTYRGNDNFDDYVSSMFEDKTGKIWVLGRMELRKGAHLFVLNKKSRQLEVQLNDKCNPNSIASSYVFQPFIDNAGNIWLSTFGDGIIRYIPGSKKFENYPPLPCNPNFPAGNAIWGFAEDEDRNIWIPLFDKGVDKFNPRTKIFTHFSSEKNCSKPIPSFSAFTITTGQMGDLWISTLGGGVIRTNTRTGVWNRYLNKPSDPRSIASNFMRKILVEDSGKLWIAFAEEGIDHFDPKTGTSEHYKNEPGIINSLANNNTWCLLKDRNNELWICCEGYIDRYNLSTKRFIHYKSKSTDSTGLIADKAICIYEDSKDNLWFGTSGGGLSLFDRKTSKFRHWTETEGLANNVVYGILEDTQGNLWLSTNKGLSKFDVARNSFTNYDENDGLQSNEFNMGSCLKSSDHKLYFGGINGFNAFYPENIVLDTVRIKTLITGFQIFNRDIPVVPSEKQILLDKNRPSRIIKDGKTFYLPEGITYTKEIVLTYLEKVFTLEFAGLFYESPEKTTYRYRMQNFDSDWNYAGTRRFATYTNLSPGEYVFEVSAANPDGIWNPIPTILRIKIMPPFWQIWWFIVIEISFVLMMVILVFRFRVMNLKQAKTRLEKKVKERTREIQAKKEELEIRNLQIEKQKEEIAFQAQQLKKELVVHNQSSELALLRSQINPHFLFNTLNNIYSLVYQRSDNAPEAVMKLSEIMRYMLYEATTEKVLLQNEINYLKSFIELQLLRIKNRDFVSFNITGNLAARTISPMLLIAFVENAFKHGIKKGDNHGISINLEVTDNKLIFDITNYCRMSAPVNKDKTGGIGLTNIKRRLELLYPSHFTLDIRKDNEIYHVRLELDEKSNDGNKA
jgi:ligand-binding sensor domain-containing protein/sensor histidine kinase YesM